MTAYALMAHVLNAEKNTAIPEALPIVRWLTKQRNAYGGFSSTQVYLTTMVNALVEVENCFLPGTYFFIYEGDDRKH